MKYIYNKDSFDNAVEVDGYPWGFRLRTKRRYWIETVKNRGDRFCYATLNPKTNQWCKPKKNTYEAVLVLGFNQDNHVKTDGLGLWGTDQDIAAFKNRIDYDQLKELQKMKLCEKSSINHVMKSVKYEIKSTGTYNLSDPLDMIRLREDNKNREQKELEEKKTLNKINTAINQTYHSCLIKNNLK